MEEIDLSIIIPVYNVEKYLRSCLISILRQGLNEERYEIILIDDGTPDNSFGVIEDLTNQNAHIHVFHQSNRGPSAARNLGVKNAKGKYILYVDSDDLLIENRLPLLLDIAINSQADLVVGDYVVQSEEETTPIIIKENKSFNTIIKTGEELFLEDLDPHECYIWRTLYRKDYLNNTGLAFCEGISFEDIPYLQECYIKAGKCIRTDYPFYIYRRRHNTLSSAINTTTVLDINRVIEKVWKLTLSDDVTSKEVDRLKDNLFITFSLNMWYISNIKDIFKARKEVINDLKNRVPDLKFTKGLKQRFVTFCYKNLPQTYLKVRSIF